MIQEKRNGEEDVSVFLGKEAYADQTAPPQTPRFSTSATTLASFSILLIPSSPYIRHRSVLVYDHYFRPGMMLYSVDYIFCPHGRFPGIPRSWLCGYSGL
jgi:hypothetical protein